MLGVEGPLIVSWERDTERFTGEGAMLSSATQDHPGTQNLDQDQEEIGA